MGLLSVNACVGREVEMEERRKGTGERMVALGVEKERQQSLCIRVHDEVLI